MVALKSAQIDAFLARPNPAQPIVLLFGPDAGLVRERAEALTCYVDAEKEIARLIDDEMREAGLTIAPDARTLLVPLLGGDRLASRSEIRKLALYAHGQERVELDDVVAVVADASMLALD